MVAYHMAMSDVFDGHGPQPVVYECREDTCELEHETVAESMQEIRDRTVYYMEQGHRMQVRFTEADGAVWRPDPNRKDG